MSAPDELVDISIGRGTKPLVGVPDDENELGVALCANVDEWTLGERRGIPSAIQLGRQDARVGVVGETEPALATNVLLADEDEFAMDKLLFELLVESCICSLCTIVLVSGGALLQFADLSNCSLSKSFGMLQF